MVNDIDKMKYLHRNIEEIILRSLKNNEVTAVIGPRQCGKTTLVKQVFKQNNKKGIYLDLEKNSDKAKLHDPEWFFTIHKDKLICIDEIQRAPELFPLIRSLVDEWQRKGSFLILGSASRDLLKQSSESLAGRVSYKTLTPFLLDELGSRFSLEKYFFRGGFPKSALAPDDEASFEWREDFISTFLERDLLQWSGFTPVTMRRLWQMLAHVNGQTVNFSMLSNALGISSSTVKSYIDLLEGTFMVTTVQPYHSNTGKRLVKAPKVYITDSGITSTLLGLRSFEALSGHPAIGGIWEQIVLTNLQGAFPNANFYYYRTSNGAEVDFVMKIYERTFVIECKSSLSPSLSKGNYTAMEDILPDYSFIAAPVKSGWNLKNNIEVVSIAEAISKIKKMIK